MADPTPFRPDLEHIPGYRAGRRPIPQGGPSYSLASNETPYGPLPGVMHASLKQLDASHRYPDPTASGLVAALAARFDVGEDQVATGTGSVAICQQAIVATCGAGSEVVFAWRSFEAYPILTRLAGAVPVAVPLAANGGHDLRAMAAAVTDRTGVMFVCSPNNPTGPIVTADELLDLLDRIPERVLVVLDEAYYEFAAESGVGNRLADGISVAKGRPNVLALRTFSKAYGLAGLRVGYGIGSTPIIDALRRTSLPFGVSSVAQAAAVASLDAESLMGERVRQVVAERNRIVQQVRSLGHDVPAALGNYYWLPLGSRAVALAEACQERGVTVRAFPGDGVRVTVAEPEANDLVVAALRSFS